MSRAALPTRPRASGYWARREKLLRPHSCILGLAQHLLARLRTGWNASGLWSKEAIAAQDSAEGEAVEEELMFRLGAIRRAALLRAGELPHDDALRLKLMCDGLIDWVV